MTIADNCLVLECNLGTSEVEPLYETMKCLLATEQDIRIDGSKVESIDTSVVQLLVSFTKSVDASGCRVNWDAISEKLEQRNVLLGLDSWMQCD